MSISISKFFASIGAPLYNTRWSWGAVNEQGDVFLRVWQDESLKEEIDGKKGFTGIFYDDFRDPQNPGFKERERHIEMVRNGAKCYLVMCEAVDVNDPVRSIKDFNKNRLFIGGSLHKVGAITYIHRADVVKVNALKNV